MAIHRHTVAACASSLVALDQARRFLNDSRRGDLNPHAFALVVTSEAALTPLLISSYRRLGVLAPLMRDAYRQRPLDARREGFILTEAGAAVLLRRLGANEPPPRGAIELVDTATACEAYDLIRPNPGMDALRHIAGRLFRHGLPDAVHAHAPGTPEHDPAELAVYRELRDGLDVYAGKGALGHTLGASGLVSLVVACLSARARQLPPMPWLDRPIDPDVSPKAAALPEGSVQAVFASGFAGHTAGALIRRHA